MFSSSSSVSPNEVAKFSGMSQSWWDPSLNPLIGMNPTRLDYIQTHAVRTDSLAATSQTSTLAPSAPLEGMRALDVGCGGGLLSESLCRLGCDVVAIDPSESLVNCAKAHSENAGLVIDYRGGTSLEQLAQNYITNNDEPKFSIICILEVLEHVDNIDSMLHAASQLLDPTSGRLFVSTLNRTYQSYLLAILGAEYVMHYVPPKTHDWNLFRSPELVTDKMHQVGLCPAGPPVGMVLAGPPPPLGTWQWKLSPTDLSVNWIGCYRHAPPPTSTGDE
jgi:2-polyprenyl-6-hydroxyphenyl methylase/3-demethylubiquinone-9 3-methyltransferase